MTQKFQAIYSSTKLDVIDLEEKSTVTCSMKITKGACCIHEQTVLYFSTSPHLVSSPDQSFCVLYTDITEEKSAPGTAPTNSPAVGICLTVDFVFLQSFRYSGLIKVPPSLTQDFIS